MEKSITDWNAELPYAYWLNNIEGIGKKTEAELLQYAGTAQNVYHISDKEAGELLKGKQLNAFLLSKETWNVEWQYQDLLQQGILFYPRAHSLFPKRLADIPDAPNSLYVKGKLPDEQKISVAVIGARRCSEYGRYMARQYGEVLAGAGIQVISGMANGVDSISQQGAIAAGGETFAVLGCGVDICYPEEKLSLYQAIMQQGGVLSEYVPGTLPKAGLFPLRNRIISGLSDAVVVIEAKEKSGTLITVDMALEQGRDVYALPGRVTDALSKGCNRLIRQGAGMVTIPEDLIYELTGQSTGGKITAPKVMRFASNIEEEIWHVLDYYPQSIQMISAQKQDISMPVLLQTLLGLCMSGYAEQITNGYYVKII